MENEEEISPTGKKWNKLAIRLNRLSRQNKLSPNQEKNLFVYGKDLFDNHKNKEHIYTLLELAANKAQKASDDELDNIHRLLEFTYDFLNDDKYKNSTLSGNDGDMRGYAKELDSPHCPYWLKVMIGIVFLILTITLILSVAALVISLTGGSAAIALIAPAIALAKPVIDVLAATSIVAAASTTIGVTATTGATAALAGAGAIGAAVTGRLSFFFMHRPFTDCVEKIIKTKEAESTFPPLIL